MHINEHFDNAIDALYKKYHYLAASLANLGYPKLVEDYPPTAGVMFDKTTNKICFLFNVSFYEKIKDNEDQFMFTIVHEVFHIIFGHVFLLRNEMEKRKSKDFDAFARKFNIAADCVVNDTLVNSYKFKKVFTDPKTEPIKVMFGKDVVKMDCEDLTAMEVYHLIPDECGEGSDVKNHDWHTFFDENGNLDKNFVDAVHDFLTKNKNNSALTDEEVAQVDKIQDIMENCVDGYAQRVGDTALGINRKVTYGRESLRWDKILHNLSIKTNTTQDVWNRPNKKISYFYPNILLPSSEPEEIQEIVVAIDTSMSINYKAASLFVTLLKNTPKHIKIQAISFDTMCYPYDIYGSDPPKGGGGTNFGIIENYIQKNFKKYPKAVMILTDGDGSIIHPQYPERWCWLLYGNCNTAYCRSMKHYCLNDLLR